MMNPGQHESQARAFRRRVFFSGSTALDKGVALCYDRAYGTATDADGKRDVYVAMPTSSNNLAFAGVTAMSYSARSGGQWIEIYEPGSVCEVSILDATTVNSTRWVFGASAGYSGRFGQAGLNGRGQILALQSVAAVASNSVSLIGPVSKSLDGTATIASTTLTKTAAFTNAQVGDKVYILGGGADAAAAGDHVIPGVYTIASVTSANAVVLSSAAGGATTINCAFFCVRGNPTAMAMLVDGDEECGGAEWVSPIDNDATTAIMVGGMTYIPGGFTLTTGNGGATLANGTQVGQKKGFYCMGTITTNDFLLTVTSGVQMVKATALASLAFDAAAEYGYLTWYGTKWISEYYTATAA